MDLCNYKSKINKNGENRQNKNFTKNGVWSSLYPLMPLMPLMQNIKKSNEPILSNIQKSKIQKWVQNRKNFFWYFKQIWLTPIIPYFWFYRALALKVIQWTDFISICCRTWQLPKIGCPCHYLRHIALSKASFNGKGSIKMFS